MNNSRWPNLFIVGAPKAGTTSLHRYLQDHPQVYMSRLKEPGYFAPDVTWIMKKRRLRHPADEAEYLKLFLNAGDARRVGESSTNYLMSHQAPRLIRAVSPDARVIVMVRNPVDLLYAFHNERLSKGAESIADFDKALELDDDRRSGKVLTHGVSGYGVAYRDWGRLGQQLKLWFAEFGRDRVHVIVYDDFISDTGAEYAKVLRFLEVDPEYRPDSFEVFNSSHRRRGGLRLLLRNRATLWLGRSALPAILGEQRTSALGRRFSLRKKLNKRSYERPPLDAELRRRLEAEFADDVRMLGTLLGRDLLSEWFEDRPSAVAA